MLRVSRFRAGPGPLVALALLTFLAGWPRLTLAALDEWLAVQELEVQTFPRSSSGLTHRKRHLLARVVNTGERCIAGPFRVVIDSERDVRRADGYTDEGLPYVNVRRTRGRDLCPGEATRVTRVKFDKIKHEKNRSGKGGRNKHYWNETTPVALDAQVKSWTLQLLHTADNDGGTGQLNVENFSAVLNALRAEYPDRSLTLSSGDNWIPGPFYQAGGDDSVAGLEEICVPGVGRGQVALFNVMGFQAAAVGNHELDDGPGVFAGILAGEANSTCEWPGAQFPYLSANLDFATDAGTEPLVVEDGQEASSVLNGLARSAVITVDGETIGIVGASSPTFPVITNTGDITVSPADSTDIPALAAEIQSAVDALTANGVDKIVLLAHMQQIAVEQQLATLLEDVDIIVAGGSNTLLADGNDILRIGDSAEGVYPLQYASPSGEPVLVVNTDGDFTYLGRLVAGFDSKGRLLPESLDNVINGAWATDDAGVVAVGGPTPLPAVQEIVATLNAVLVARDGNILGNTTVYLDGRRSQVPTQETNMGNLTADANLWYARQYDASVAVSIKNGGGIRAPIGDIVFPPGSTDPDEAVALPPQANPVSGKLTGDISQFDVETTLLFNNTLTLLTASAAELRAIVEHGVAATAFGATPGQFPQVGGISFSFDPTAAPGSRVTELVVDPFGTPDTVVSGGSLQGGATRTFRLVTLSFLADGGDSYPFPATSRVDLAGDGTGDPGNASFADPGSEQDALAEYLRLFYPDESMPFTLAEVDCSIDTRIASEEPALNQQCSFP